MVSHVPTAGRGHPQIVRGTRLRYPTQAKLGWGTRHGAEKGFVLSHPKVRRIAPNFRMGHGASPVPPPRRTRSGRPL